MAGNPYYDNTLLLLRGNGSVADESGYSRTIANGGVSASASIFKYGSGSLKKDSGYLSTTAVNVIPATADYCIEGWIRHGTLSSGLNMMSQGSSTGAYDLYFDQVSDKIKCTYGGTNLISTTSLTANVWMHVAQSRLGNDFKLFINGTLEASATNAGITIATNEETRILETGATTAYVDDLAVYDFAKYTVDFTPPLELKAYQLNDKLIPRKDLLTRRPMQVNQNVTVRRLGI